MKAHGKSDWLVDKHMPSLVDMGYPRLSECEGASAKERIPGYALTRGPPITAAGVGAVV